MRRGSGYGALLAVSVATAATMIGAGPASRAGAVAASGYRTVRYGQAQLDVPAAWPVYDLARSPRTCVRFDQPAVYLGAPGPDQDCPAHAVGRAVAVLVSPYQTRATPGARARSATSAPVRQAPESDATSGVGVRDLPGAGLSVSVSSGEADDPVAERILASVRDAAGPAVAAPAATPAAVPMARSLPPANVFTGGGFDTCAAPSAAKMQSWLASPYRAVGAYIGGVNRACGDGNLSSTWVGTVTGQGWHIIPIYVGEQAPCVVQRGLTPIGHTNASGQGLRAADDAVADARRFGLDPGSTLYVDLEAYNRSGSCVATVLAFLNGWTNRLHQDGYRSGVYSSANSGITDLAATAGPSSPDVIWIARWDNTRTLFGDPAVPDTLWAHHQRIKQYNGGHAETYANVRMDVDSDVVDAPLAVS